MKVDFYVLEEAHKQQSLRFVCQLIETCYVNQEHIYVYAASQEEAYALDDLLWTVSDDGFIPHHLDHPYIDCHSPIHIGEGICPNSFQGVFFNLHHTLPLTLNVIRLVEIVFCHPTMQQLARERYKQYRDQGRDITTYKIKSSDL